MWRTGERPRLLTPPDDRAVRVRGEEGCEISKKDPEFVRRDKQARRHGVVYYGPEQVLRRQLTRTGWAWIAGGWCCEKKKGKRKKARQPSRTQCGEVGRVGAPPPQDARHPTTTQLLSCNLGGRQGTFCHDQELLLGNMSAIGGRLILQAIVMCPEPVGPSPFARRKARRWGRLMTECPSTSRIPCSGAALCSGLCVPEGRGASHTQGEGDTGPRPRQVSCKSRVCTFILPSGR